MFDDDLERDDEFLDDEDEENDDDESLGRSRSRPQVRPFSSTGPGSTGGSGSTGGYGSSSRPGSTGGPSGSRSTSNLPGSRPAAPGGYQSRFGTSGSGSGSSGSGSSRPGSPPGGSSSRPPYSGVIGARRDNDDDEQPEEKREERRSFGTSSYSGSGSSSSSPQRPGSSPFRSTSSSPTSSSSSSSSTSSSSSSSQSQGAGGFRSRFGGSSGGDKKPDKPKSSGSASGSSALSKGLGNLRSKLPGSGGDKKPTSSPGGSRPASAPKSGGGSSPLNAVNQRIGDLRGKMPFGKGKSDKPDSGRGTATGGFGSRPGTGAGTTSSGAGAAGASRFGSRSSGSTSTSSSTAARSSNAGAAGGAVGGLLSKLPFVGKKDDKPRTATTREKLERASKAPRIDERGLTLDNKLDILGVALVLASLAMFFSSMSATKGQLTEAINTLLSQLFGIGALAVPVVMFAAGMWLIIRHFGEEAPVLDPVRVGGVGLLYIGALLLFQFMESFNPAYAGINLRNPEELRLQLELSYMLGRGGGWLGSEIYYWLVTNWSEAGMVVFMMGMFIIGFMLLLRITAAELAIFFISLWRSFVDAQRRRSETREARARLRAAELAAAAESRVNISKPAAAELPGGASPALPATTAPGEEPRPIPITMGGRTVTAVMGDGDREQVAVGGQQQGAADSKTGSVAARLRGAVPLLGRSSDKPEIDTDTDSPRRAGGVLGGLLNRGASSGKADDKADTPAQQPASATPPPAQPAAASVPPASSTPAAPASPAPPTPAHPAVQANGTTAASEPARLGDLVGGSRENAASFTRPAAPAASASSTTSATPVHQQPAARPVQPDIDDEDEAGEDEELGIRAPAHAGASGAQPGRPSQSQSVWGRPTTQPDSSPQNLSLDERRERLNALRSGRTAHPAQTPDQPQTRDGDGTPPRQPQQPAASVPASSAPEAAPPQRQQIVFTRDDGQGDGRGDGRSDGQGQNGATSRPAQPAASPAFGKPAGPPVASSPPPRKRREWKVPDYRSLLSTGSETDFDREVLLRQARTIEETLQSFGAPGRVVEVNTGPVITQFGVEPDYLVSRSGKKSRVKVGAIAQLDKDLQLALGAKSIRIEAPVPGKGYVGIEVPNEEPSIVSLRDVMESDQFQRIKAKSPLALALGQSVDGTPISADLSSMPHLLIAGTTGSGKSVLVNAIICGLLINNPPDRVKFVMVDPKRVELTGYNGIPHLVAPVVVDLERTVGVLKWVTREMDERYKQFSNAGARNIEDFNKHVPADREPMPYIVVIIDELADLMMMAPDETERVITRIAALARATGIHLVIATQRPSVDVVTGLIKANFPARVAFAVAGGIDSRVILDQPGAERLLGRGDMLYLSGNSPAPLRLQGVWVSEPEITNITRYWKRQNAEQPEPHIIKSLAVDDSIAEEAREVQPASGNRFAQQAAFWDDDDEGDDVDLHDRVKDERDELYDQAVEMVRRLNKASVSLLQRRLRIGYTRAARLIDMMEAEGVVGPAQEGSKPREVLPPKA